MLGGVPINNYGMRNAESLVPGVHHADRVLQAHAILWRASQQTVPVIEAILEKLRSDLVADNAIAGAMVKFSEASAFFFLKPGWLVQRTDLPSKLQLTGSQGGSQGYQQAWAKMKRTSARAQNVAARKALPANVKRALGPNRRGCKPIKKQTLKNQRQCHGSKGGKRAAGNGSSESLIKKKINSMLRWYRTHDEWPPKRLACEKWRVSAALWSRAKRENLVIYAPDGAVSLLSRFWMMSMLMMRFFPL